MGTVFNIQKFSLNDGPGIRTTVFLKGCPLNCIWCHNPESKKIYPELFYVPNKCIGCTLCLSVCPNNCHSFLENTHIFNRDTCTLCGKCATVCAPKALEIVGEEKSVEEVLKEVLKDKPFYENSGGGVTISGGEPMANPCFTYELLKAFKENGLHTAIETSGFGKKEDFIKIAPLVDLFLFDYKETDPKLHKEFTGVSNELILENLKMLDDLGNKIILRCPIIPGYNDRKEHFEGISNTANSLKNILEINIEPYHPLGKSKAEQLGKVYILNDLTFPEDKTVEEWMEDIKKGTSVPVKKA